MRRLYVLIAILLITSLACSIFNTVTPVSTPVAVNTQTAETLPPTSVPVATSAGTQAPSTKPNTTPTQEEPTKTPYPTSVLDSQMTTEINLIQSQVERERGLKPKSPVPVVLLSPDELRSNVVNDFLADYTDEIMTDDVYEFSIIGLLDPGFDLRTLYTNLLSEEIGGYYDTDVKEMFVVQGTGFNGPEHLTYAHEYTHALQDQNYDINHGLNMNTNACDKDSERCAAVRALIEGDAYQMELTWFQKDASTQDQQQIADSYNTLKSTVYDSAPKFIKDDFTFDLNQGLIFVQYFYDKGGWPAVDALYKNPPVSTEQILHPELYPADVPIKVDLPDVAPALGTGWREVSRNTMGEWYTYLILADGSKAVTRLDDLTAQTAAAGWGGDEYLVLRNDSANTTAFVMKDIWDTANDAGEFSAAMQKYLNSRFALIGTQNGDTYSWSYSGGYSSFLISGSTTIWIIAPDAATAQIISGLVKP